MHMEGVEEEQELLDDLGVGKGRGNRATVEDDGEEGRRIVGGHE